MSFETWAEFWAMGGHGLYVWLCYGVGIFVLALLVLVPRAQRRTLVRQLYQQQRRQEAQAKESGSQDHMSSHQEVEQ